jgi:hypothetical protein
MNETDGISLRIPHAKGLRATRVFLNRPRLEAMSQQVSPQIPNLVSCKCNFRKPALMGVPPYICRHPFQSNLLFRWTHTKTSLRSGVLRAPDGQSENIGIKPPRFFDVTDIDRHMIDSGDTRPTALLRASRQHYARQRDAERDQARRHQCWEGSGQAPHAARFYRRSMSAMGVYAIYAGREETAFSYDAAFRVEFRFDISLDARNEGK